VAQELWSCQGQEGHKQGGGSQQDTRSSRRKVWLCGGASCFKGTYSKHFDHAAVHLLTCKHIHTPSLPQSCVLHARDAHCKVSQYSILNTPC
jgi:hypothetical protein